MEEILEKIKNISDFTQIDFDNGYNPIEEIISEFEMNPQVEEYLENNREEEDHWFCSFCQEWCWSWKTSCPLNELPTEDLYLQEERECFLDEEADE